MKLRQVVILWFMGALVSAVAIAVEVVTGTKITPLQFTLLFTLTMWLSAYVFVMR